MSSAQCQSTGVSGDTPYLHAVGSSVDGRTALVRTLVDGGQLLST